MTRFVSAVGFSPHQVTQSVAAYGPATGDSVELVHPIQPDAGAQEQTEQAVMNIKQMLNGIVRSISIEKREIDTSSFEDAVDTLSHVLTNGQEPVVCLGAGASDIANPLFVATIAHQEHVLRTMSFSDIQKSGTELSLPDLTTSLPGRTTDLFLALAERMDEADVSVRDLAEDIEKSEATASRRVDDLVSHGLAWKERKDQSKVIKLTTAGRLLARNALLEYDEGNVADSG